MAHRDGQEEAPRTNQFKHFDIISDISALADHHFIGSNGSNKAKDCFNDPTSAVPKKIAKEWKILESDLPESIFVRVYEQRIDLLRAVIIGAPGTPYHDGLFFFDIVLPSDYPKQPPKVYYHSHGLRLNPNLYSSGMLCLSLISTWHGKGVELWTPSKSTILQLLVSIQGLVLNDKPYFNEPGYEVGLHNPSEQWVKRSLAYNEEVFLLSCKTMQYKLRKQPPGFQSFVVGHFRQRGNFILSAILAYKNGDAMVGQYQQNSSSASSSSFAVSSKFKANLEKTYLEITKAFRQLDVSISQPDGIGEEIEKELAAAAEEKRKRGFASRIMNKLKKIFE